MYPIKITKKILLLIKTLIDLFIIIDFDANYKNNFLHTNNICIQKFNLTVFVNLRKIVFFI